MPIETQLIRDNQPQPLRWGWWHIQSLAQMAQKEGQTWNGIFLPDSSYQFTQDHTVIDPDDGEVFAVKAGDVYTATR